MEHITALILNVRKHTGNNVIVDTYTQERGRVAFIYSFTKSNKGHKALIAPMNWVAFSISGSNKGGLSRMKELYAHKIYQSISINPIKSLVALFLAEILSMTLKEEHPDQEIFNFLNDATSLYDETRNSYDDFHLCFLSGLAALLGIAPPVNQESILDNTYAMWEGKMNREEKETFKRVCLCPINQSQQLELTSSERTRQLNIMLDYFLTYATGFKMPKSLELFRGF